MPRAIWKGAIGFGLVTIPVSLVPALRREELSFHMLRASDSSPISFKRVAKKDGKEVPWDQIVKGYEYEKGKYVILKPEDFARVDVEATQTVDILSFVNLSEVDPLLFNKPYFLQAGKGGEKAYALLRDSLEKADKIAIAKVVIKTRQYLAAVKPKKRGLMLELMYFPDELVQDAELETPPQRAISPAERKMAAQLIESMTVPWDPSQYDDDYQNALEKMIEEKVERGEDEEAPKPKSRKNTNVVDLAEVLKRSLARTESANRTSPKKSTKRAAAKKTGSGKATTKRATPKKSKKPRKKAA